MDTESLVCSWKQIRPKKVQRREKDWLLFEPTSTHVASKLFMLSLFALFGPEFTTRVPNIRIEKVTLISQRYNQSLPAIGRTDLPIKTGVQSQAALHDEVDIFNVYSMLLNCWEF